VTRRIRRGVLPWRFGIRRSMPCWSLRRAYYVQSRPLLAGFLHPCEVRVVGAEQTLSAGQQGLMRTHRRIVLGGLGRPGEARSRSRGADNHNPANTDRFHCLGNRERTPPGDSRLGRGPRAQAREDRVGSRIADSRAAGSVMPNRSRPVRTCRNSLLGFRTTAVTSCPASTACSSSWRPIPPVAARIVSLSFSFHGVHS